MGQVRQSSHGSRFGCRKASFGPTAWTNAGATVKENQGTSSEGEGVEEFLLSLFFFFFLNKAFRFASFCFLTILTTVSLIPTSSCLAVTGDDETDSICTDSACSTTTPTTSTTPTASETDMCVLFGGRVADNSSDSRLQGLLLCCSRRMLRLDQLIQAG